MSAELPKFTSLQLDAGSLKILAKIMRGDGHATEAGILERIAADLLQVSDQTLSLSSVLEQAKVTEARAHEVERRVDQFAVLIDALVALLSDKPDVHRAFSTLRTEIERVTRERDSALASKEELARMVAGNATNGPAH